MRIYSIPLIQASYNPRVCSINVYQGKNLTRFWSHAFDEFGAVCFPDVDAEHLTTGIIFFLWAFAVSTVPGIGGYPDRGYTQLDDLSDEGELQSKPEIYRSGVEVSLQVLRGEVTGPPTNPYAAMLQEYDAFLFTVSSMNFANLTFHKKSLWNRLNSTATPGTCTRQVLFDITIILSNSHTHHR